MARSADLQDALRGLKPHDHLCLIYESPEEWRAAAVPFMATGLERGEKCCYIVHTHTAEHVRGCLREEGVDVAAAEASGQFVMLESTEAYTRDGGFDPDRMIALLISETHRAVEEGYPALRVTGEMTWILGGDAAWERLIEYEAKLNRDVFANHPCLAICQYDRRRFAPDVLLGVLATHPMVVLRTEVHHSPYYIPATDFLGPGRAAATLRCWLQHLHETEQAAQRLRQTNERLQAIVRASPLAAYVLSPDGTVQTWSPAAERMFGWREQEVVGRILPIVPEAKTEEFRALRERVLRGDLLTDVELVRRRKDGSPVQISLSCAPLRDADGNVDGMMAIIADITERKRTQEALRESEERFRRAAWIANDVVFELDEYTGRLEWFSDVDSKLGYARGEFPRTLAAALGVIHPDDRDRVAAEIARCLKTGEPFCAEGRVLDKHGNVLYGLTRAEPVTGGTRSGRRWLGVITDITERKRAEEEIESLARFPAENPGPVLRFDADGTALYANEAGAHLLCDWCCAVGGPVPDYWRGLAAQTLSSGTSATTEVGHRDRIYSFSVVPVVEAGYVNLYGRDITDRKRAEEAIARHRRDLQRLSARVIHAHEEERKRISQELHDEMGQVLTAMSINLATMEHRLPPALYPALAESLAETASLAAQALEQVRELSLALRPPMLDDLGLAPTLRWHVNRVAKRLNIAVAFRQVNLRDRLPAEVETVVYRVVQEALTNVARHAEASRAGVRVERKENVLDVTIEDDGRGFNVEHVTGDGVLEPGMGLMGMRERVAVLGGTFSIWSRPGEGTRLSARIPLPA